MPFALMLQDACDQVPFLADRLTSFLGEIRPEWEVAAEPINGWVRGCPEYDPMATYFSPIVSAVDSAQQNATRSLVTLELRPVAGAAIERVHCKFAAAPVAGDSGGAWRVQLGDLYRGEARDVLVSCAMPAAAATEGAGRG